MATERRKEKEMERNVELRTIVSAEALLNPLQVVRHLAVRRRENKNEGKVKCFEWKRTSDLHGCIGTVPMQITERETRVH